tara:strand:- start:1643 stop:2833 length:1191 start_codon:yes stop_codon:yes gene_type:complete
MASNITVCRDRIYNRFRIKYLLIIIMNGVVVALMLLLVLLVIGAVIYFTQLQETETEDEDIDTDFAPVETIQEIPESDPEPDQDEFDIVNGWIYDTKYNYKLGIKEDGTLGASEYNAETPDQTSKWSFEPSGSGFHIGSTNGKFLKITSAGAALTSKATGTAKIMLNQNGEGVTLSNSTKKYFIKLEKSKITIVRDAASASTFMIDASQYYIKNYSSDKHSSGTGGDSVIDTLSNFGVSCASGVLSKLGMSKQGSKYQYDYGCVEGEATSGELLGSKELEETDLKSLEGLRGAGFQVKCDEGALANFKLLDAGDGKASYEYDCRDVALGTEEDKVASTPFDFGTMENKPILDPIVGLSDLKCKEGHVLTEFKFTQGEGEGNAGKTQLSGICKKIAA